MKRGTPSHWKVNSLAKSLNVQKCTAVGLLECLWHFTAQYCPQGDISNVPIDAIADSCFWDGEPQALIDALVSSRWLDKTKDGMILIHDWHDHAEDSVHMFLARSRKYFGNGQIPKYKRLPSEERALAEEFYSGSRRQPPAAGKHVEAAGKRVPLPLPLPLPCQAKDTSSPPQASAEVASESSSSHPDGNPPGKPEAFEAFWRAYPKRVGKLKAKAAWQAARKLAEWPGDEAVVAAVKSTAQSSEWKKDNGRYVPKPEAWLVDGRWLDDVPREENKPPEPYRLPKIDENEITDGQQKKQIRDQVKRDIAQGLNPLARFEKENQPCSIIKAS